MKKIFIVYGHHNTKDSFNAAIRDTFIDEAKKFVPTISTVVPPSLGPNVGKIFDTSTSR